MGTGTLSIDLDALAANWTALDKRSAGQTAAVVKADGYGIGAGIAAKCFAMAGARSFFVAVTEEAAALRAVLGEQPSIYVCSGHMEGDARKISDLGVTPILNSPEQISRHQTALPGHPFGLQLDTGMNRLGLEPSDWDPSLAQGAALVMSHLACADEPAHPMNATQLAAFADMTQGIDAPKSLAATGGILLGSDYHFDLLRPGIGLYGGLPFDGATPVVTLDLPIIQTRSISAGESVGYGNAWTAKRDSVIATVSGGYGDGLHRAMTGNGTLYAQSTACPIVGRVSMDLIGVDITDLRVLPSHLTILGAHQTVDQLAEAIGTIGYEILTSLGHRYARSYLGGHA